LPRRAGGRGGVSRKHPFGGMGQVVECLEDAIEDEPFGLASPSLFFPLCTLVRTFRELMELQPSASRRVAS
jgi:hypothetical protein